MHERVPTDSAVLFGLLLVMSCNSSAPAAIPDPGGPFHTNVAPDTTLGSLTNDQTAELCVELEVANQAYLLDAVNAEVQCRSGAVGVTEAAARYDESHDGGADGGSLLSACQSSYDRCQRDDATSVCLVPVSGCGATVELLSACINEIANADPLARCVNVPTCDQAADSGWTTETNAGSGPCFGSGSAPPLPACERLTSQCPNILPFIPL